LESLEAKQRHQPTRQKAMSWSDQSEEGPEHKKKDQETEIRLLHSLLSLSSLAASLLLLLLLLIQQEHHHHQEDEEEEERPSRYLREAPLSHPLSLMLSYNNI